MRIEQVRLADVPAVADTLALAFAADPVWGLALAAPDGSTEHLRPFWSVYVHGALAHGTVWMTPDAGSVATWIRPGAAELSDELEAELFALTAAALGPEAFVGVQELWERFEAAHPHDVSHYYLSLLATHPNQRGQGIAQQLMAVNLAEWDRQGIPSYLESTNALNNHRYERAGFTAIGGFGAVLGNARVTTMWRDAAPPHSWSG